MRIAANFSIQLTRSPSRGGGSERRFASQTRVSRPNLYPTDITVESRQLNQVKHLVGSPVPSGVECYALDATSISMIILIMIVIIITNKPTRQQTIGRAKASLSLSLLVSSYYCAAQNSPAARCCRANEYRCQQWSGKFCLDYHSPSLSCLIGTRAKERTVKRK